MQSELEGSRGNRPSRHSIGSEMAQIEQKQNWRSRLGWLGGQMFVIFLGVTAAFVVENYQKP